MKDLGAMSFIAADRYKLFFEEQGIACEIKEGNPLLSILIGGGWGDNKRVNLLVADEDYERAKALFVKQEQDHAKRVEELTPDANRAMAVIALVTLAAVVFFYFLMHKG